MNIRYRITLTSEERSQLQAMVQGGQAPVRKVKRAQILLAAARGSSDERIAANVAVGTSTVFRTKRRFVEEGLEPDIVESHPCGDLWSLPCGIQSVIHHPDGPSVGITPGSVLWTLSCIAAANMTCRMCGPPRGGGGTTTTSRGFCASRQLPLLVGVLKVDATRSAIAVSSSPGCVGTT